MPRKVPGEVRGQGAACWSHERSLHWVDGLGPRVNAAIAVLEHTKLRPGDVGRALRRWETRAKLGDAHRPGSNHCGIGECCGPGPRGILKEAIHGLPGWAKPYLRRRIAPVDSLFVARTMPDPLAELNAPWWERRRPVGWP